MRASTENTTAAGEELAAVFSTLARGYAELGWALVRLDGKVPKEREWQTSRPDPDPEHAAGLWHEWGQRWNLGIVLGPSRLAVVEYDTDEGGQKLLELFGGRPPQTPTVRTGRDRLHFYFTAPENGQKVARDGIELRLGPHQCAAPPSVHPDTGRRYHWLNGREPWNLPLGEVPQAVLDFLEERANGRTPAPLPETIPIGEIDRTLASLAGSMRRRNADEEAIYAALLATLPRCEPGHTHTEADCRRIARSVARYEPSQTTSSHLVPARPQVDLVPRPFPVREGRGRTTSSQLVSGWRPIDLVARGVVAPQPPDIIELFYCGRRHLLAGESEAAKTWLELVAAAAELREGARRRLGGRRPRRRR